MITTSQRTRELQQFIAARRLEPFAWGRHDCCTMAADWVLVASASRFPYALGDDATGLRGRYADAAGALRLAREVHGHTELPDLFACERWPEGAGLAELPPLFAQRGDLVSVMHRHFAQRSVEQGEAATAHTCAGLAAETPIVSLGICLGDVAAVPGPVGLVYFAQEFWRRSWRVES